MDTEKLKEVILEQNKNTTKPNTVIERIALKNVADNLVLPHALIISGIRRSGKSTFLEQITDRYFPDGVYYLNFEDERLLEFSVSDFNLLFELFIQIFGEKKPFCFDEIQNIPDWERFVRRMQDQGYKFIITGSNASLLSQELGTKLTGRSVQCELFPFSFSEYLLFQNISWSTESMYLTVERAKLKQAFDVYLQNGGMPEYVTYQNPIVLKNVYENILFRDIVARYELKESKVLREIAFYLLSNTACLFSYNSLKNTFLLGSSNTVKNYVDYLENSWLFFTIPKFSHSMKEQSIANKKIYCIDNGLINHLAFRFSKNSGRFLENLVFLHLRRRYSEIYYYKTNNNLEVDFYIRDGANTPQLIQVTESMSELSTRERELRALFKAMDECSLTNATIITHDASEIISKGEKTIHIIPAWHWCLQE